MERLARTHSSTFAIGGVSCSADSFVVAENLVLRMNICAKNPPHRQAETRWCLYLSLRGTLDRDGFIPATRKSCNHYLAPSYAEISPGESANSIECNAKALKETYQETFFP
jgi:hypothetical protein